MDEKEIVFIKENYQYDESSQNLAFALVTLVLLFVISILILQSQEVTTIYLFLYSFPSILSTLLSFIYLLKEVQYFAFFGMCNFLFLTNITSYCLFFYGKNICNLEHAIIYYLIIIGYFCIMLFYYHKNYMKFPFTKSQKNSSKNKKINIPYTLIFYPIGVYIARNIEYSFIAIAILFFNIYLSKSFAFLFINITHLKIIKKYN